MCEIPFHETLKVVATTRPVDHVDLSRVLDDLDVFLQLGRGVARKPGERRFLPKQTQKF